MLTFTQYNYPKQFASLNKNSYRLKDYNHFSDDELAVIAESLREFVYQHAKTSIPISSYRDYQYIGSGWEWSTFRQDEQHVIKIPAGRFLEVGSREYAENTEYAYGVLCHYYGQGYIAETSFGKDGSTYFLKQKFVDGLLDYYVPFGLTNHTFLLHLSHFVNASIRLLAELEWLPDIEIKKEERGFLLKNVICDSTSFQPSLIDFTHYLDPFRLYPGYKTQMVQEYNARLEEFKKWIEQQIAVCESGVPTGGV